MAARQQQARSGRCLAVYGEGDRDACPGREHQSVPGLAESARSDGCLQCSDEPGGVGTFKVFRYIYATRSLGTPNLTRKASISMPEASASSITPSPLWIRCSSRYHHAAADLTSGAEVLEDAHTGQHADARI